MNPKESNIPSLTETSSKNRSILEYIKAYNTNATPYVQNMFHPIVMNCCSQNKTCTADLRVSKICFVGESGVGKTSIINRFCHNSYNKNYKATIGVDFEVEWFTVLNIPYKLQIWDTAGQERFRSVSTAYYRGSHVVVAVFDLSDLNSLDKSLQWMDEASKLSEKPLKFLIGNKTDLIHDQDLVVIEKDLELLCKNIGAELWCLSAKSEFYNLLAEFVSIVLIAKNIVNFFLRLTTLAFEDTILKNLHRNINPVTSNPIVGWSVNSPLGTSTKGSLSQTNNNCFNSCG